MSVKVIGARDVTPLPKVELDFKYTCPNCKAIVESYVQEYVLLGYKMQNLGAYKKVRDCPACAHKIELTLSL